MKRHGGGFTLLEILVALAVTALLTAGIAGILSGASTAGLKSDRVSQAVQLAHNTIQAVVLSDIDSSPERLPKIMRNAAADGFNLEIRRVPDELNPLFERVTVAVFSPELDRTFTVERLIRKGS
ncbi:type II secretion system protein [bacterium]|nr:type II secretion system protein [candidate division CSSED10-310 bacterium]